MITARDLVFKWTSYAIAISVILFLHSLLLGQVKIWGVTPFLPPILLSIIASFENSYAGTLFGLIFGICCDLTLTAPLPCLYTLSFAISALIASFIAKSALQTGFLCSLVVSAVSFCIVDFFLALVLLTGGHATLIAFLFLCIRELLVSLLLLPLLYPALSFLHQRFTI